MRGHATWTQPVASAPGSRRTQTRFNVRGHATGRQDWNLAPRGANRTAFNAQGLRASPRCRLWGFPAVSTASANPSLRSGLTSAGSGASLRSHRVSANPSLALRAHQAQAWSSPRSTARAPTRLTRRRVRGFPAVSPSHPAILPTDDFRTRSRVVRRRLSRIHSDGCSGTATRVATASRSRRRKTNPIRPRLALMPQGLASKTRVVDRIHNSSSGEPPLGTIPPRSPEHPRADLPKVVPLRRGETGSLERCDRAHINSDIPPTQG